MMTPMRIAGGLLVLLLFSAGSVLAQQIEIPQQIPQPMRERPREPIVIPPGDHDQMTRPPDANYYPYPPLVNYDPAFIEPLSKKIETPTSTGRVGMAGWISPSVPVGAEQTYRRWHPGWFVLGFAIEWGGPPPAPAKRSPTR